MDHAQILGRLTEDITWTVYGGFQLSGKAAYDAAIDGDGFVGRPTLNGTASLSSIDALPQPIHDAVIGAFAHAASIAFLAALPSCSLRSF